MILAIDIDEVLANFIASFLEKYNAIYGTDFKREDFFVFYFWKVLGLDFDEFKKRFIKIIKEDNIFNNLSPKLGAQEAIKNLSKYHKLVIVTGRPKNIANITENWLKKYFFNSFSEVYYTRKKILDQEDESKFSICKRIGAEFLIEDEANNAEDSANNGLNVLLFDAPWNKKIKSENNLKRIYSWSEILSYFSL